MTVSLKKYALILSATVIAFFLAFSGYVFLQINEAQNTLSEWKLQMASHELSRAITKARDNIKATAEGFAEWEEVRQQILNPAFYPYWRDQRMMSANHLPKEVTLANVYNARGESLLSLPTLIFPMSFIPSNLPEPVIKLSNKNKYEVIYFAPVYSRGGRNILGFVSISVPLLPMLINQPFQHLDARSLKIESIESEFALSAAEQHINFKVESDITSSTVKTILTKVASAIIIASLFIAGFLYILLGTGVRRPLQSLIEHIHLLRKNPDFLHSGQYIEKLHISELNEVGTALNAYQRELDDLYGSLDQKNRELHSLAYTDPLTGMKNRRAFNDHWEKIISIAESSRLEVSMLLFDVNHFKAINDSYGHNVGDELLIKISTLINRELRKGDHLYRLGGDEFGAAIINCDEKSAYEIAERCLKRVSEFDFKSIGIIENVRVSVGFSCADSSNLAALNQLAWQADVAVYQAKKPSNKNVMMFRGGDDDASLSLFSNHVYSAVFDAIEHGKGLVMHYQPIINLDNGEVSYFESLVRIKNNDEYISPAQIFPIISARNFDIDLDKAIVKAVIRDLDNERIPKGTGLSINLSGPSVACSDLVSWVEPLMKYIKDYKFVFEVTETSLISQMSRASANLNKLKSLGFKVALDDFGSGYSSLRYLGSMPVDIVKFDISLISELNNQSKRKLIFNLCNMIKEIGYKMVAEGIEELNTHNQIILAGFDYGQGYLYGKPGEQASSIQFTGISSNS